MDSTALVPISGNKVGVLPTFLPNKVASVSANWLREALV